MNPKQLPLYPFFLLVILALSACTTANPGPTAADRLSNGSPHPGLAATAQADQYWRDAQATTVSQQATQEANYRNVQGTAVAAQATSAAEQTRDALSFSMTVAAATAQAQETAVSATRSVEATSTAQAQANAVATVTQAAAIAQATRTAEAEATAAALVTTRQAWELEQVRREQLISNLSTVFLGLLAVILTGLLLYLLWLLLPTLVSRAGLVRYGQHGNPLLLSQRHGRTVLTDPLRMMQAALSVDEDGNITMPSLVPDQLQAMLAGGVLRTLIEQARHAPGHAPILPGEVSHLRRLGPWTSQTTTRHDSGQPMLPALTGSRQDHIAHDQTADAETGDQLPLPDSIPWTLLANHTGSGVALGAGPAQQLITLDLARLPHLFVAGMSGAGKTRRLLRPLVAQALANGYYTVLMNESGADFAPFYDRPNVALVRGDVTTYMAVIEAAMGEMERREQVLRERRISEWSRLPDQIHAQHPFILLAIDELLALATTLSPKEQKQFWALLTAFASRARKVGMCSLGLATDPTYRALGQGGLNYRSQCGRISFRMFQAAGSRAILDQNGAEQLAESHFLALLDEPGVRAGVAANPGDEELARYLARQTVGPISQPPRWLPSGPQPSQNRLPPPPSEAAAPAGRVWPHAINLQKPAANPPPATPDCQSLAWPLQPPTTGSGGLQPSQTVHNRSTTADNHSTTTDNRSTTTNNRPQPSPTSDNRLSKNSGCGPTTTRSPQPQPVAQPVVGPNQAQVNGQLTNSQPANDQPANSPPSDGQPTSSRPQSSSAAAVVPPFPTDRPPTAAERAFIRQLYADGLSRNGICRHVYGYKDGRVYGWVREALDGDNGRWTADGGPRSIFHGPLSQSPQNRRRRPF